MEEWLVFEPGDRSLFFKSLALTKGDIEAEEPEEDRIGGVGVGIGFSGISFSPSLTFLIIA